MGLFSSKKSKTSNKQVDSLTDSRDGKVYKTVKIGNQIWMAENLNYDADKNNCWFYDNDPENGKKYGRLYNWYSAMEVAPPGWHLPSLDEWSKLISELGGLGEEDRITLDKMIKGGTSGFDVLFGGYKDWWPHFKGKGDSAIFWSSTKSGDKVYCCSFWDRTIKSVFNLACISLYLDDIRLYDNKEPNGYSIRCVKD